MSDNGPPFNGDDFKKFACEFDFEHITSSPHFYQSNGFIEAMVKKVKNAYKKTDGSPNAQVRALLQLQDTPSQQIFLPQLKYFMDTLHKEQSFQDQPNQSTYVRFGRDSLKFKIYKRNSLTKPIEPRIYAFSRLRSKYSSSKTNKEQTPWNGWLELWLKSWIVVTLTWSKAPMAESTGEIEHI